VLSCCAQHVHKRPRRDHDDSFIRAQRQQVVIAADHVIGTGGYRAGNDHIIGSVLDLDVMTLYPQAKFVSIDEQTDHNVVHLNRFGEADCLTH